MDIFPRFSDVSPVAQTAEDLKPTLIISWWCTCYAMTIIFFRVFGRYIRVEKLFIEDIIMLGGITLLVTRIGLAHGVLKYGSNNVSLEGLTSEDISARELGSKLVLASRMIYPL